MGQSYGSGQAGFGPVSWGVVGCLLALMAAAVWVARHPVSGPLLVARIRDAAQFDRLQRLFSERASAAAATLRSRLRLEEVAGAALLASLAAVVLLAVGFTALLDDVLEGEGVATIDQPAARWLAEHRDLWLTRVLTVLTEVGGPAGQTAWVVLVSALAARRARSWLPVALGVVGGGGIAVVVATAKVLVGRDRPAEPFAVIPEHGYSFPSGHATGGAAVGLLCAWMLCRWVVRAWAAQVTVWAATIATIGLVGFSRVYLGVHYVTDVLAGWLLGAAWAGAVILVASWWSSAQRQRDASGGGGAR